MAKKKSKKAKKASVQATTKRLRGPGRASPAKHNPDQDYLIETDLDMAFETSPEGGVECLGQRFETDEARREHFLARLKEGLDELHEKLAVPFTTVDEAVSIMRAVEKWPMGEPARLREMAERMRRDRSDKDLLQRWKDAVGFPHGEIEDILRLSDPPYYTACPNPFLAEFVKCYGRPYDANELYSRKPFAVDVSEGKTDALYKAHGYHTKVPHLAIVPSILHYTEPGDVVLDGFCGSGMTGVAAQFCGTAPSGYRRKVEAEWAANGLRKPKWGARRVILNDLSPAATFIAANYNTPFDVKAFAREGKRILEEVEEELGWMYETMHTDGKTKGRIEYTVWSEVFTCPECSHEIVFLKEALDQETKRVRDEFPCPGCSVTVGKKDLERVFESTPDALSARPLNRVKFVPALVSYRIVGKKQRFEKTPTALDLKTLADIGQIPFSGEMPSTAFPYEDMWEAARLQGKGICCVHHLFLPRAAHALAALWRKAGEHYEPRTRNMLLYFVEQAVWGLSVLNRYQPIMHGRPGGSQVNRQLSGVYYVASQHAECNPWYVLNGKLKRLAKAFAKAVAQRGIGIAGAGTTAALEMPPESVDYIFTDPPFGDNFAYAELNFLVEAWHRVISNMAQEAVVDRDKKNKKSQKSLLDYRSLMEGCFREYCRVLKPGRWMTVVFHNSKNAVWNAIQGSMLAAGFVVADVRTLDKQQRSFKQVSAAGTVQQDLIISAYKPNGGLEERFKLEAGTEEGAWDFVRTHLGQLPIFVEKEGRAEVIVERQHFLLYDRMVAFHVQRGVTVPLSAAEFYAGLAQRFIERDGMYFLPEQAAEYDQKRMNVQGLGQTDLFVNVVNEESAIRWLYQRLKDKPQTFQELHPQFMREIAGWDKHEITLELSDLLAQNFLRYDGEGPVPTHVAEKLSLDASGSGDQRKARDRWYVPDANRAADLEKLREKALLKEFQEYRESTQRKIKAFRIEAVRAGFKRAWQDHDYKIIIEVAGKIPDSVLQEDPKLLMFYDNAVTRVGEDS